MLYDQSMRKLSKSPNSVLLVAGLILALLATISLAISSKPEKNFTAGSPEATVQLYLDAIIKGDNDLALTFLDPNNSCESTDLDRAYIHDSYRVNLISSVISGTSATVKIDVEYASSMPFDPSYSNPQTMRLEKLSSKWLLTGIPWPLYDCGPPK